MSDVDHEKPNGGWACRSIRRSLRPAAQSIRGYGIALDGRFLKVAVGPALVNELLQREPIPPQPRTHVHVVQNWFDELQRLVPSP